MQISKTLHRSTTLLQTRLSHRWTTLTDIVFTARCTIVQSAVLRSHVVCPSLCPSVTLVDCDHIGWNSSKIISRSVSVGRSLSADPNVMDLLEGDQPEIWAQIKVTTPVDLIVGDIRSQIAAEWSQISHLASRHLGKF